MNEPTISADEIGYADALGELDDILRELEGADVDVDRLADRVARAADLIALCRERIGHAKLRIDEVIADLDAATGESTDQGRAADGEPA
ncbi:MAG: exodeoxyribonuclease VII small subunit [Ilumatobacter sp.]|uniref:exodeoxyribonuclease VII small subunit n=1 Tax=Ilumatobacter sp. TaxID=1967498 RepID=UPI0026308F7A|nr:exodeoxyribonuclease VII small subunit [Ilumatobacter sp.]MDJ0769667.1 exodeoxyribonuclease VII small subunit [Ilumatobacter sp.]